MDQSQDDLYMVFARPGSGHDADPATKEEPLAECFSYAEACRVKDTLQEDCVIRYVGCAGGGD
jgi:hypothetical protein